MFTNTFHKYASLWLLAFSMTVHAQNYPVGINEKQLDQLQQKIRLQQATQEERTALQKIAVMLQNTGQQLDEHDHDYKRALQNIDKAVLLYDALDDTLSRAFSTKYKGRLLVRLGKNSQAKTELQSAIYLYQLTKTGAGIASSQLDLARVFELENKRDSAIYYADLSRVYWKLQANSLQVLLINNLMVYQLVKINETDKAASIYHDSEILLSKQPTHWQPELDFYFTSMLLFKEINDQGNAAYYNQLYAAKTAALQREGIAAKSYYEMTER